MGLLDKPHVPTSSTQVFAVFEKEPRDGDHGRQNQRQHRHGPFESHPVDHLDGEKREDAGEEESHPVVDGQGGRAKFCSVDVVLVDRVDDLEDFVSLMEPLSASRS